MLPTLCGPYRNCCWFDHSSICIFFCFPGEVEASNDHAMACLKLLLLVPDSFHIEMCSAEVALSHTVLPLVSFPPVSIIVPMSHVRRHHTGAAVQLGTSQKRRRQTVGRKYTSTFSSFGRHTGAGPCSVPGTQSLSLSWFVRLDVCSEVANGLGILARMGRRILHCTVWLQYVKCSHSSVTNLFSMNRLELPW